MRFSVISALALGFAPSILAQGTQTNLSTSLAQYGDLSTFKGLLDSIPGLVSTVIEGHSAVTVLVPTNEAITVFLSKSNVTDISQISATQLQTILKYHVMDATLKSNDFGQPRGVTVPTLLQGSQYNNRSAGQQITGLFGTQATGQVLFVQKDLKATPGKFKVRQSLSGSSASVRAGVGQTALLTAVDGTWDGGSFQIVDAVLSPPLPCSSTIRSQQDSLKSLGNALERTKLWSALDHAPNVTCLAPSTTAFRSAGNPDQSLEPEPLTQALLFHTLPEVTYTNFLVDGQVFSSLNDQKVTVRIVDNDIYFNDAKVISPNVITNNGLIHVLDKVMSPNGTAPTSSGPTSSTTSGAPTTPTATPSGGVPNAGHAQFKAGGSSALLAFAVAAAAALL